MIQNLRTIRLTPTERFGFWGNDVTRIQYDPTADPADQDVRVYAGGRYVGNLSTADRPDVQKVIEDRRQSRT